MTLTALQSATVNALYQVQNIPPVFMPNTPGVPPAPRVTVDEGPVQSSVTDLSNGDEDATWLCQVTITAGEGEGLGELQGWVQRVTDAFRAGRRIGPGYVTQRPFPDAYLQDESGYRAVMTIRARAVL